MKSSEIYNIAFTFKNVTLTLNVLEESFLELGDPGRVDFVKEPTHAAVDDRHLNTNGAVTHDKRSRSAEIFIRIRSRK
jgi:hypothetical protein